MWARSDMLCELLSVALIPYYGITIEGTQRDCCATAALG